jgi:voltage-gated potassium channel
MLLGVGMIALPVAIIATGFNLESTRHQFVATWSMVARVPLFASMDESEIAEIARLLYTRVYLPGVPIVRTGDAGDAMFVIASGEAVVELSPRRQVLLKDGDFFGEMALLERRRHAHDVVAKTRCRVYVLDAPSLARLSERHPEILDRIRAMAAARAARRKRKAPPAKSAAGAPQPA